MIDKIILTKNTSEGYLVLEFLANNENYDFYFTEANTRYYVTDIPSLKKLIKSSVCAYGLKERGDYQGIALIWKGIGENKVRHYIKLSATNSKVARDLLTVLLWNSNKDLFVKIKKDSQFLNVFKQKGFKFIASRGIQLLLYRKYIPRETKVYYKKEDE